MSSIILTIIIVNCLLAAIYLHQKERREHKMSFRDVLFWIVVIITLLTLLATWLRNED